MGKSQIHCSEVACATTGQRWPNGERGPKPGNVIMVVCEDALDQVVVPRLIAVGADWNRVKFLKSDQAGRQTGPHVPARGGYRAAGKRHSECRAMSTPSDDRSDHGLYGQD